ncbi:histidine kinase [Chitinophaga sancti]|uniref:sensor histidine kinase n=1 Tax=Chitinophaga sancti TaxID=1004 RepID=UPI002A7623E6|nr:ATP-binding protein [Chitinophaga sancti]WPQ63643.1 histidine kinase [Chitinophaga sancti]
MLIDKDIIFSMIIATLLFLLMLWFVITFWLIYRKRRRMHLEEKQQLLATYEQEILRSQLEMKEQTLKNISQEIHDNIGQVLSLAKLNVCVMEGEVPDPLKEKAADTRVLLSKVIHDLRDLSRSMDTDTITERGLYAAMEGELEMVRKTGVYEVQFSVEGQVVRVDANREVILFRIFQEILHNVIKHAEARVICVTMNYEHDQCVLRVVDDGNGFETGGSFEGMGLRNMQKRCRLIQADLQINPHIPRGTVVNIVFPFK